MKRNPIILINCPTHQRTPMLKFAVGRDYCREQLRLVTRKASLKVLYYTITRDRFLLLAQTRKLDSISAAMRKVKVVVAAQYRRAKQVEGPFWKARNPITLIQTGQPAVDCIQAMTALIPHTQPYLPEQWPHVAYHEIIGARQRYRLIDMHALTEATEATTEQLQKVVLQSTKPQDDPIKPWTDATAVGSQEWISNAAQPIASRYGSILPLPPSCYALHTPKSNRRQHIKAILKALAKPPR